MSALNSQQMATLKYHSDAGDRIAYYSALAAFGVEYGRLALGVVLNSTTSGAAANAFFWRQHQKCVAMAQWPEHVSAPARLTV